MPRASLEERLAALELRVAELGEAQSRSEQGPNWRSTIGMFTGDEIVRAAFAEALRLREADRRRARRPSRRQRRTTS